MRLLTYTFLQCPKTKAFPLQLEPTKVETIETEYNKEFIQRMIPRLDWNLVRHISNQLEFGQLPESAPQDEETFRLLHKLLLETHIKEGVLKSQDGTVYPIKDGIPNMLITQVNDE